MKVIVKRDRDGSPWSQGNLEISGQHGRRTVIRLTTVDGLNLLIGGDHLPALDRPGRPEEKRSQK